MRHFYDKAPLSPASVRDTTMLQQMVGGDPATWSPNSRPGSDPSTWSPSRPGSDPSTWSPQRPLGGDPSTWSPQRNQWSWANVATNLKNIFSRLRLRNNDVGQISPTK